MLLVAVGGGGGGVATSTAGDAMMMIARDVFEKDLVREVVKFLSDLAVGADEITRVPAVGEIVDTIEGFHVFACE